MSSIKFPQKELIISAFCGGMILSLLELANMCAKHENIFDVYFYIGMFVAGVIGIFGLLLSQTKDIGGAITAGMAAPQLLAGLTKTGNVVNAAALAIMGTVYAQDINDTLIVQVVLENKNEIYQIKTTNDQFFDVNDSLTFSLPRNDAIIVSSNGTTSELITFKDVNVDTITLEINYRRQIMQQQRSKSILRGLFAQQYVQEQTEPDKIEINKKLRIDP